MPILLFVRIPTVVLQKGIKRKRAFSIDIEQDGLARTFFIDFAIDRFIRNINTSKTRCSFLWPKQTLS